MKKIKLVNGGELISLAASQSGVNFFAGYPITPANTIYSSMIKRLQQRGDLALSMSDEISAVCLCIGASIRGAKAMTATSGPGFCLMIESLSYAFMAEIPLLIVLVQRLGPSTGAATQNAEGDILLSSCTISGGYYIPVFAPNSIKSTYAITKKAINISEKYRTPVILLTEKDIVMSSQGIDFSNFPTIPKIDRSKFSGNRYKSYDFDALHEVPPFACPGEDRYKVAITGSCHDKKGRLAKRSPEAIEILYHLKSKIDNNIADISSIEKDFQVGAKVAIISFMATDLACREAVAILRKKGIKVNHLTLFSLFPINEKIIKETIIGCEKVIVPEENLSGQYLSMIRHLLSSIKVIAVNKICSLISPEDIIESI